MINLVCIICPRGCRLTVDEENGNSVCGNLCPRGAVYAHSEVTDSRRTITTTVKIEGGAYERCPVKSEKPIPRSLIFDAMRELNSITIHAPIKVGDTILEDVCNTGIRFIATRSM